MNRRRLVMTFLWPLLAVGVAVLGYFAWTWNQRARYEAAVRDLRARGVPVSLAELELPDVPEEDNGALALFRFLEIHEDLSAGCDESLWALDPYDRDAGGWRGEERDWANRIYASLRPAFEALDDSLRHPWIVVPREQADRLPLACSLLHDALGLPAKLGVRSWAETIDARIRFLEAWQPWTQFGPPLWSGYVGALASEMEETTHRGLAGDEPYGKRWGVSLAGFESRLLPAARRLVIGTRAGALDVVEAWSAGREPGAAGDPVVSLPWKARWWGRGHLYLEAMAILENLERAEGYLRNVDAVRAALSTLDAAALREDPEMAGRIAATTLRQLAQVRLARIGLAAADHVRATGAPPAVLEDLADAFPGGLPPDPLTGGPFVMRRTAGGWVIATAPDGDLLPRILWWSNPPFDDAELRAKGLLWRLPPPP